MPQKAQMHSVDALESFRVKLVQYLEKASAAMDDAGSDVKRTLFWLEDEQKPYWENQVRLKRRALEEIQNEVFGAKLSQMRNSNDAQQIALLRAKRAFHEAEEKLRRSKMWRRRFQSEVEPLGREVEKLQTVMVQDLKKGAAFLERIIRTLEDYADRRKSLDPDRTDKAESLGEEPLQLEQGNSSDNKELEGEKS